MIQQESLKKRFAKLAAPIFIETLLIMMLGAVDTIMLSRHSDSSVAAVGVVNQIIMFAYLFSISMAQGGAICIGHLIGEKKPRAAFLMGKYVFLLDENIRGFIFVRRWYGMKWVSKSFIR